MTKKRFWYDFEDCNGQKIVDFKEDKEYPLETIGDFIKIEDLLNEQHETIERLKRNFQALDKVKCEIAEENEQLKKDNKEYIRGLDLSKATSQSWASDVRELREQNYQLEKENEQLKSEIQMLKVTIGRNEGYIDRLTHKGEWR